MSQRLCSGSRIDSRGLGQDSVRRTDTQGICLRSCLKACAGIEACHAIRYRLGVTILGRLHGDPLRPWPLAYGQGYASDERAKRDISGRLTAGAQDVQSTPTLPNRVVAQRTVLWGTGVGPIAAFGRQCTMCRSLVDRGRGYVACLRTRWPPAGYSGSAGQDGREFIRPGPKSYDRKAFGQSDILRGPNVGRVIE